MTKLFQDLSHVTTYREKKADACLGGLFRCLMEHGRDEQHVVWVACRRLELQLVVDRLWQQSAQVLRVLAKQFSATKKSEKEHCTFLRILLSDNKTVISTVIHFLPISESTSSSANHILNCDFLVNSDYK